MKEVAMTIEQARATAIRHGRAIDLIDAAMTAQGCDSGLLVENHIAAALGHISGGKPGAADFKILRSKLDDLEILVLRAG